MDTFNVYVTKGIIFDNREMIAKFTLVRDLRPSLVDALIDTMEKANGLFLSMLENKNIDFDLVMEIQNSVSKEAVDVTRLLAKIANVSL